MTGVVWRRCEGSGRAMDRDRVPCPGCGITVVVSHNLTHLMPVIGPRAIRTAGTRAWKVGRIPVHDRVDLVAMIRAGAFGPFPGTEQLAVEVS